jgi:serine/threonine protein phosphatase PrpC
MQNNTTPGIACISTASLAANKPCEDRLAVTTHIHGFNSAVGVFDGHGGWQCAEWVSRKLFKYVGEQVNE